MSRKKLVERLNEVKKERAKDTSLGDMAREMNQDTSPSAQGSGTGSGTGSAQGSAQGSGTGSAQGSAQGSGTGWMTPNQLKVFNFLLTSDGKVSIKKLAQETGVNYKTAKRCIKTFVYQKVISKPVRFQVGNFIGIKFRILKGKK